MRLDIKALVMGIIEEYKTNNPFLLAEMLELSILFHELPETLDAYRLNNIIVINNTLPEENQKWVLAHELGHYFIHGPEYSFGNYMQNPLLIKAKCEKQADKFASEFLLSNIDEYTIQGLTKEQIASLYSVPQEYIEYKLAR